MDTEAIQTFDKFWNSGLHGAQWPKETHCIYKYTVKDKDDKETTLPFKYKKNQQGKHVEIVVLEELNKFKPVHICMYLNWSPCGTCSKEISKYQKEHSNCTFEIYFSSLYYINKPKCPIPCESCHRLDDKTHTENLLGLKRLLNQGIQLNPICALDTWNGLCMAILESAYDEKNRMNVSRQMEDTTLKLVWDQLKKKATALAEDAGATGGADDITEGMRRTRLTDRTEDAQ